MPVAKRPGLFFLRQFLSQPRMVGSIVPTPKATVRALLDPIDWHETHCVVEFGPGTGVFTRELLRRVGRHSRVIAIDTNPVFANYLRASIRDPRLISVHGSAADVGRIVAAHGFGHADHVISGLPFSTIPRPVADAIMDASAQVIRPGGAFLIYQYSRFVLPMLQARFSRVDQGFTWRCIPPARLFWARQTEPESTKTIITRAGVAESSAAA